MSAIICTKESLKEMEAIIKSTDKVIPIKDEPMIKLEKLDKSQLESHTNLFKKVLSTSEAEN